MKLFAKVSDPDLLLRSLNEQGAAFYRRVGEGGEGDGSRMSVEAVYFSASRIIYFRGGLTAQQFEILKSQAHRVKGLIINDKLGLIEVNQIEA